MFKKIVFIIIASLSIISCRKDPTDIAPVDQLDNSTYPKTISDLETFLVPGYSNFRTVSLYGFYMLPINVLCSDHTACMTSGAQLYGSEDFATNNISINSTVNAAMWQAFYQGVSDMNVFFDRAKYFLNQNKQQTVSVNPLLGEAYFLRAYYLMQLECFYGEKYIDMKKPEDPTVLGVPLPTILATTVAQTSLPRSSAYKVWAQVINDLRSSIQAFQNSGAISIPGHANIWSANALLGKAFVFTQQYDSAKLYLGKVINNGTNSLMQFSQYKNAYQGNPANEFNDESLFEINVERQATNDGIFTVAPNLSLTTSEGLLWSPSVLGWNGLEDDASCLDVGGRCQFFVHDKNLRRFGFQLPVPIDTFTNPSYNPANGITALNPAKMMDPVYQQQSIALRVNKSVDPRLYVCALQPWVDSCGDAFSVGLSITANIKAGLGAVSNVGDSIPVSKFYNIPQVNKPNYYGWSFRKYTTTDNCLPGAYGNCDAANIYLLRLADVYLLYAEACMNLNMSDSALEYINRVHRRAYDQPVNVQSIYDYKSLTDATMAAPTDANLANNPLAYERFTELFAEGGWWFDVCRWGNNTNNNPNFGMNEASYYLTGTSEDPNPNNNPSQGLISMANWSSGKAYCYPIPSAEIGANAPMAAQPNGGENPGY